MSSRYLRPVGIFLLCSFLSLNSAQAAGAQPPGDYTDAVEEAVWQSSKGNWSAARKAFREAHELFPNARTLRGLGMVAYQLQDYPDAYRNLLASLLEKRRALTAEQDEQVRLLLAETRRVIGRFTTRSLPSGSKYFVDDLQVKLEENGALLLPIGQHNVRVEAPEASGRAVLTVRGGEVGPLQVELVPHEVEPAPEPEPLAEEEPEEQPTPAAQEQSTLSPWPAISMIAGGVLVVSGAALFAVGRGKVSKVENASGGTEWDSIEKANKQAPLFTGLGVGFMGVGAAVGLTGVYLHVAHGGQNAETAGRGFMIGAGRNMVKRVARRFRSGWGLCVAFSFSGLFLNLACKPELKEGFYSCEKGGCPTGWYCHAADLRCYSEPEESGVGGAGGESASGGATSSGGTDSGGTGGVVEGEPLLGPCEEDGDCASGKCLASRDAEIDSGICSTVCTEDAECSDFPVEAVCTRGACIETCDNMGQCPEPLTCMELADGSGAGRYGCYETTRVPEASPPACGPAVGFCPAPFLCMISTVSPATGLCATGCESDTDCMPSSSCLEILPGQNKCVAGCTGNEDCASSLACGELIGLGDFCVPPNWAGREPPLNPGGPGNN